jgi:endonuclease III
LKRQTIEGANEKPGKMHQIEKQELYQWVVDYFLHNIPVAETELEYHDPFHLIVAVILSAQCTDKRVNQITPALLRRFPDPWKMAEASQEEILSYISSCSYPNNKARHLLSMSQKLIEWFNGIVPSEVSELMKLPGVGRKTANVIAAVVFNKPVMAVDTHVFRVAARIGLSTGSKTPLETEKQLTEFIPEKYISIAHHWLILHGRYICKARNPECSQCGLTPVCNFFRESVKQKQA